MKLKKDNKKSVCILELISISSIKQIIKNYNLENTSFKNEINDNGEIIEKFDIFFKNKKILKYSYLKSNKFITLINYNKYITKKEYKHSQKFILKNKTMFNISICFLRNDINNCEHNKIRRYLNILLFFYIKGEISIDNLFSILEIILISIIEALKNNCNRKYQIFNINEEPLLYIKDIIETIIHFPILMMRDQLFIEKLTNLFDKLFKRAEKLNIILKENEIWLKLFENNSNKISFELYEDDYYKNSMKKIIEFLEEVYKNNIPKNIYNEIYQKSSIDFIYYFNILSFLKELFKKEIIQNKQLKINKGAYLLQNFYIKENLNFYYNEFSIILSFKLLYNEPEISFFNLINKGNYIFSISIKNNYLKIKINSDFEWNTNIKIDTNIFYFICIVYNKKKCLKLYINYDEISNKKIEQKKFEKKNVNIPKFGKSMSAITGAINLYAILGDIFIINKEFNIENVRQLFNSKGEYSDLIIRNNTNSDLINKLTCSKNYENIINNFKSIKYEYHFLFSYKLFLSKENNLSNSPLEFNNFNCYIEFFNSKGIEFLTFMLHNINSIIIDSKLLDIYLSKTLEFLSNILESQKYNEKEHTIEFDKESMKNQLNIFFLTLFNILKSGKNDKKKYFKILSDNFWNSLLKIFSHDLEDSIIYKKIIASILLDYDLFDLRNYIIQINEKIDKIKINELNDELLYKLFALDFIFELNNIKHKNFSNLITSMCISQNKNYCKALIKYVIKVENEIKNYHYLKIIYLNINNLKNILSNDIFDLYEFIEKQFTILNHFHCKYCSYMIILCHLLKQEILIDKKDNKSDSLSINNISYKNISFNLFFRTLFIENFNLKNEIKLQFIKSKNKDIYFDLQIFKSLSFHPFELYDIKKLLVRFKYLLKYIDFLMSLEHNEHLKNVLEYSFNFIIDFAEKIKSNYINNIFIREEIKKNVNEFYNSEEFTNFFILYLKFNEIIALDQIKKLINLSFFKNFNAFYFRLLNMKYIVIEEKTSNEIKSEIIEYIFNVIINYKKNENEKIENFKNIILFLVLIHKNIYQYELINIFPRNFFDLFIKLYSFLRNKKILLSYSSINLVDFAPDEKDNISKVKNKLVYEIILDILLIFFIRGDYNAQILKNLLIKSNSSSSIFYEQDEKKLTYNKKIKNEEEEFFDKIDNISFCLYFLIYFLGKNVSGQEENILNFINNIIDIIFNDLKNLYMNNKKISSKLKKLKIKGKNFDIYNELLDICNKSYKNKNFNIIFLHEQYNLIITQLNNEFENEKDINIILGNLKEKNRINYSRIKSYSISKQYLTENGAIKDITKNKKNGINYINNSENEIKKIKNTSSINYLNEEINKISISNLYFKLVVGDDYQKEITKILFNPKEYYIWNKFSFFFKKHIFFNKKFIKISKSFKTHLKNSGCVNKYNNKDDNFYLNYPTKIRNYTIDQYYRPLLKPCMNFFNSEYLKITHPYIKDNLLKKFEYKEENIDLIKYNRIIPKLDNEKYFCELFKNKGNVFGYIELTNNFFIFKNSPNDDLSSSEDPEKCLPFLNSIKDDRIIDQNKYVLIYYDDIKEIIKRRICLLYIGLEIFMKNNKSYMFNFFEKKVINKFIREIKIFNPDKNKNRTYSVSIDEEQENQGNKWIRSSSFSVNYLLSNINIINQNKPEMNFKLIEDPISEFKRLLLNIKNKKEILSNFDYLLLINKYSSRTYNDYNQYLIFPLLYLDKDYKLKRDLSKVLSLNKENSVGCYNRAKTNYSENKYHFDLHYSNSGIILYYLIRLIPFTYQHILFQSMKFDIPNRLFSSLNHIFNFFQISEDNRELIPEFYSSFDFLLNLNHNDFGIVTANEKSYHLNNVNTYCKYSFPEFIIKSRNQLEQSDLSPWIDNIFGAKQTFFSEEQPNLFILNSYEEFNELEKIKEKDIPLEEKIEQIKEIINFFKFGISPAKVFQDLNKKMNITTGEKEDDFIFSNKKDEKCLNDINKHILKKIKEKLDYYFINTKNDDAIELIFKYSDKIEIFKLKFEETYYIEISKKIQEQINIEPYENSLCEILPNIYCIVRHIDNTISFISKQKIISIYHFYCLVTAVEKKYNKNLEDKEYKEIFLGDEKGFLHLVEINFESELNQKNNEINNIKIKNSVKVHEGIVSGLLHNERLNIVFSWSDENEDYICINNDYDLNLINIINIGKEICIKEILVSKYDLIYISCYEKKSKLYKVFCYTLNGIKISFYEYPKKIVKCFVDEKINIIFENSNGFSFHLYTFDELCENFFCDFNSDVTDLKVKINYCQYYPKIKKYLIICSDNKASFFDNDNNFI